MAILFRSPAYQKTQSSALSGVRATSMMSSLDEEDEKQKQKAIEEEQRRKQRETTVRKSEENLATQTQQKQFQGDMQGAKYAPGTVKPMAPLISPVDTDAADTQLQEDKAVLSVMGGKGPEFTPRAQKLVDLDKRYGDLKKQSELLDKLSQPDPGNSYGRIKLYGSPNPPPDKAYLDKKKSELASQMYVVEKAAHETGGTMDAEDYASIQRADDLYKKVYEINKGKKDQSNKRFQDVPGGQAIDETLTQPVTAISSLFGVLPGIVNRMDAVRRGDKSALGSIFGVGPTQKIISAARKDANAPETLAGKTSSVLSNLAKFGLEVYATQGLLSQVPYVGPVVNASKAGAIPGGTARLVPTLTQNLARGGLVFGTREGIVQTAEGLGYDRQKLVTEAAVGAVFEGFVAPALGKVWRKVTTTRTGESVLIFRPGEGGAPGGSLPAPALPGGDGGFAIPKTVKEVVMKTALDLQGVQRRMIFSMDNGTVYEMAWSPQANGTIALQVTRDSPNWLKQGAMGLISKFKGEGADPNIIDVKAQTAKNNPDVIRIARELGTTPDDLATTIQHAGNNTDTIEAALRSKYGKAYKAMMDAAVKAAESGEGSLGSVDIADPLRQAAFGKINPVSEAQAVLGEVARQYNSPDDFVRGMKGGDAFFVPVDQITLGKGGTPGGPVKVGMDGDKFVILSGSDTYNAAAKKGVGEIMVTLADQTDDQLRGVYRQSMPTSLDALPGFHVAMASAKPVIVDVPVAPEIPEPGKMATIGVFSVKQFLGGEMYRSYKPYFEVSEREHRMIQLARQTPPETSGGGPPPEKKPDETKPQTPLQQSLSQFRDDPEIAPIHAELQETTSFLEQVISSSEEQIAAVTPRDAGADSLVNLAQEIRGALRTSPTLPGGQSRAQFFTELATNGDSVKAISTRLQNLADQSRSITVSTALNGIVKKFGAGTFDDLADFTPFQDAIVSGKPKSDSSALLDRAERVIAKLGDFEVEEGKSVTDVLAEIDMLESQLHDRLQTRAQATQRQPQRKTAKQTSFVAREGATAPTGRAPQRQRETRVSGRELIQAITQVSKAKAQTYRIQLRDAVSAARQAQKSKDKLRFDMANAQRESIKSQLVDEIRKTVPPERRGKFLAAVKNTRTRRQLEKELERRDKEVEASKKQEVIYELKSIADSPLSNVDVGYRREVEKVLAGVDFSKPTEATVKKLRSRLDFIERTGGFAIPAGLKEQVSRLAKEPTAEMSLKTLEDIRDGLNTIIQMGQVSRSLKVARMKSEREKRLAQLLQTTVNRDKAMKDTGRFTEGQLAVEEMKKNMRRSVGVPARFTTKARVFDAADGLMNYKGENVRLWKENTYDPLQRAARQVYEDTANWMRRIIEEVGLDKELLTPKQQEKYARALYYDQKLKDQMIASGWTYERPTLTEEEEKVVKILQQEADKYHPQISAIHALENNEYLPKVKNYFPLKYEREILQTEDEIKNPREMLFAETKMDAAASLRSVEGMLQLRSPGVQKRLRTDVFNILNEAIAARSWLMQVEPQLRNVHSIINSPEYKAKAGTYMVEYWNRYIKRVMGEHRSFAKRYVPDTVLSTSNFSSNLGIAYLTFRATTTVVQLDQMVSGASYVLAKYGHAAAMKFTLTTVMNFLKPGIVQRAAADTPVVEFRESGDPITTQIMQRLGVLDSSKMAKEMEAFEDVLRDAYDERNALTRQFLKYRRKAAKVGMDKFIKFTDVRSTASSFEAFKDLFLSLGATPEEALSDAEIVTMMTNGDASVAFRPEIFDEIKNMDNGLPKELARSAFLFQAFNLNKFMEVWHDLVLSQMVKSAKGLKAGTFLPRGGTPPPVKPPTKLPGQEGESADDFFPPQQGRGGLTSAYYAMAGLALLIAGGYTFNELKRAMQNFQRQQIPKMLGGRGKSPIDGDPLWMYALLFVPNNIPIVNSMVGIVKNNAQGKTFMDGTIAGASVSAIENDLATMGSFIRKPDMAGALNSLQALMTAFGVPGTSTMFDLTEPTLVPSKPKKASNSRSTGIDREGSMNRGGAKRDRSFTR
ncbi:hypothetical protein KW797_00030 [Candidatus Parcubacteria bacterium]|nr:hypothetical protein [Candidatus Parcubacteria bacterium]